MTVKDVERLAKAERKSYAKKYKELSEPLELKRFTKPEEVASLVTFLLSESASGVTGRSWLLNGPAA
jgi:NAD(P)-dependent dehydrogenase (short-subunit alcohol dehydrogenase family)